MRERVVKVLGVLCVVALTSCGDDDGGGAGSESGSYVGADEMGVEFENGRGCFGDEFPEIDGSNIFVDPDGSDDNAGDTQDAPLGTLAKALCSARPGQTVHLAAGTYSESVVLGAFGAEGSAPIVIRGDPDDTPVLDGGGTRTMGIGLVECLNVVVENIEFRNYTDAGLSVLLGADITIRDNRFVDNGRGSITTDAAGEGYGLSVQATVRAVIESNEAYRNGPSEERMERAILGTGIDTFEIVDGTIRDNFAHDNHGGGILVEDGRNVVVEGNRVIGNQLDAAGDWWDGAIWVDGGSGVTLTGNVIEDNAGPGIQLSDEDGRYPDGSVGYVLEANTIRNNTYGLYVWGWGSCPAPTDAVFVGDTNEITGNGMLEIWCVDQTSWTGE